MLKSARLRFNMLKVKYLRESMIASKILYRLASIALVATPSIALLALSSSVQAQTSAPGVTFEAQPDVTDPNNVRPLPQSNSLLSIQGGKNLMDEANKAVNSQNYPVASKKLQDARQVFNQLSNFYQQLSASFSGIDNRYVETNRRKALETADLRDEATYQLALVHRAQNQPELAVPLLIQIIRSQNPTRPLGKKAYQQLFELGFVETAYPSSTPPPSSPPPAPSPR
jgi:hypothetical protein